ncbi:MAG: pantothenate kinase, partial [Elusimicrobiaceae bacterium]|nr:pantothenate kinase [Elusimicrobiaceae bacterium]
KVVATGGFAGSIAKICKDIDDVQPHLITTALTKIYIQTKK